MTALYYICALLIANLSFSFAFSLGSTCSASKECSQGCCSKNGYCGFGPDFCGHKTCLSTCDAKPECGKYAPKGQEKCPLNVCCSQWGFCGTSEEFCGKKCQSGCKKIKRPSCSGTSANKRYVGYYESWNYEHPCDVVEPESINVKPWTHLNYAFANINPDDKSFETLNFWDEEQYRAFINLKQKKPSLKCYLSVGGWDVGGKIFSDVAKSAKSRRKFIDSAVKTLKKYGFDGLDVDWEYPVAEDRGGSKSDFQNYVKLLKELKSAFGGKYGLTIAIPASYWYLKGFDIKNLIKYVDWFNVMTYDIHGTWDGHNEWSKSAINPHTNLTEISSGLDLLWRNSIPAEKVLLGLGFYGRSFTLKDPGCNTPGCPFERTQGPDSGGALPGECTLTSGMLSSYEINRLMKQKSIKPVYNKKAGVNWMSWDNQWVSFDDAKTLKQKATFANDRCLGGTFAWALDLGGPGTMGLPSQLKNEMGLDGIDPDGSQSGSGDVYISPEIFKSSKPGVACVPPCNFVLPPKILESPTTLTFPPYKTSLEMAWWETSIVSFPGGAVSTSTWLEKTIQSTTLTIPPLTTTELDYWNWEIPKSISKSSTYTLRSSIVPPPFIITHTPPRKTRTGRPSSTPGGNKPVTTTPVDGKQSEATGKDGRLHSTDDPRLSLKDGSRPKPSHANDGDGDGDGGTETSNDGHTVPTVSDDRAHRISDGSTKLKPTHGEDASPKATTDHGQTIPTSDSRPPEPSKSHRPYISTRTITPPPYPHTSDSDDDKDLPTVSFTVGPPGPLCTENCGKTCKGRYCGKTCKGIDCIGGEDFIDPNDEDPPLPSGPSCMGPHCIDGKCRGLLCIFLKCLGGGCIDNKCLHPGKCTMNWCRHSGKWVPGCLGDCTPDNKCLSDDCISYDCSGPDCGPGGCHGPNCQPGVCKGIDCQDGACTGTKCEQHCEAQDMESAARCTEHVSGILTNPAETRYSTSTRTECSTITGCSLRPATVTTTRRPFPTGLNRIRHHCPIPPPISRERMKEIAAEILRRRNGYIEERILWEESLSSSSSSSTTTTTSSSTSPSSTSTSTTPKPSPTEDATPVPDDAGEGEVECFDKGSIVPRHDIMKGINKFCDELEGKEYEADKTIVGYYGGHCIAEKSCFVKIELRMEVVNKCKITVDGHTAKDVCGLGLRRPVDKCDQTSTEFKQGGKLKSNCIVWGVDPILVGATESWNDGNIDYNYNNKVVFGDKLDIVVLNGTEPQRNSSIPVWWKSDPREITAV